MSYSLYHGDCLEVMKNIPDKSIDMILCDLPYGTTACKWDNVIPFEPLWEQYNRVIKQNGIVVLTATQPFTTMLIYSNIKLFRYALVWDKKKPVGYFNARKQPLRVHEDILIFANGITTYNPIKSKGKFRNKKVGGGTEIYSDYKPRIDNFNDEYYPKSIIEISNANQKDRLHPTQKPVVLLEYLIKTYTNEGELVLDNCMGSGSTGVACLNTNRNFIGVELDEKYFEIAKERIQCHTSQSQLPL